MRPHHEVYLVRHAYRRAKSARPLPLPVAGVEKNAPGRGRIDAHLANLLSDRRLHRRGREETVELLRPKQRQRVGARHLGARHRQSFAQEFWKNIIPDRLRVAKECIALFAERVQVDAAQELERGVVPVGESNLFGDVALPLEAFAPHRGELALHETRARELDCVALARVSSVGELDRDALVLELPAIGETYDGTRFPSDVSFVERRQLARALRFHEPVRQKPKTALLLRPRAGATELLEHQRQCIGPEDRRVLPIDWLQLRRRLLAGVREVILTRKLLHERLAFATQAIDGKRSRVQHRHLTPSRRESLGDHVAHCVGRDPLLLERVAIPNRDRAILHRLSIDCNAIRRADLILTPVAPADRTRFVVEHRKAAPQLFRQLLGKLGHSILLHEWENSCLDRSERWSKTEHGPPLLLAGHLLLTIRIDEQRERRPVRAHRGLHNIRHVTPIVGLIEVLQLLSRVLLVLSEIEIAAVVDALDLLEAKRAAEVELDVERRTGIVRQLFLRVLMELQPLLGEAERAMPGHSLLLPVLEPLHISTRLDEKLHFHLFEFASSKDEVARRDLVPECLADLGDAEGYLLTRRLLDVEKVHINTLRCLRTQEDLCRRILHGSHEGSEHEIEKPGLGERALGPTHRTLGIRSPGYAFNSRIVRAKSLLAVAAIDERIGEASNVAAGNPDLPMHEYRRVEPFDVVARADHRVPPAILEILLQLDAEWAVVPHGSRAAVDLG